MKELTDKEFDSIAGIRKRPDPLLGNWIEGLETVGYWPKGDSIILKHPVRNMYICITRSYLDLLLRQSKPLSIKAKLYSHLKKVFKEDKKHG